MERFIRIDESVPAQEIPTRHAVARYHDLYSTPQEELSRYGIRRFVENSTMLVQSGTILISSGFRICSLIYTSADSGKFVTHLFRPILH